MMPAQVSDAIFGSNDNPKRWEKKMGVSWDKRTCPPRRRGNQRVKPLDTGVSLAVLVQ